MNPIDQLLFALGNPQVQFAIVFLALLGCYLRLAINRIARERAREEAANAELSTPLMRSIDGEPTAADV